jgi:eukaryotic-like serine/threonine-protein kinase
MSLCINPICPNPNNSDDQLFCQGCRSEILLHGRYRVLALLGEGGFGKTYEVSDLDGFKKVLKILSRNEPKYVELLQREAQFLSQLNHPGIPNIEPNGHFAYTPKDSTQQLHCLVMEKITGLDLQKYLQQRESPIDQVLAVQWLIQLANILDVVHGHNFLHRDIKPSNIMLKADGNLVLIDFGTVRSISTIATNGNAPLQVTRIISALYTPDEQMKGKAVPQSDFFALGRTFVYLLTGQNLADLYDSEAESLKWRSFVPQLSETLADFLDRLMAPAVCDRPTHAETILQQLNAIQQKIYGPSDHRVSTQLDEEIVASKSVSSKSHSPESAPSSVESATPAPLSQVSPALMEYCRQELAEFIGPIAPFICQRTLDQKPQVSAHEYIEALAQQISDTKNAQAFRQRVRP